jgi:pimeloyl-ACP methyl ester carboxylesterase
LWVGSVIVRRVTSAWVARAVGPVGLGGKGQRVRDGHAGMCPQHSQARRSVMVRGSHPGREGCKPSTVTLSTVMHRDIEVGEVSLHVRQAGAADASPVLLLHGGGSDDGTWEPMFPALTDLGLHVVAPDLRGHGRSSRARTYALADHATDARRLCESLGLTRIAVVGHSLGAYTACWLAQSHPEQVTKLVLEEPPAPGRSPSGAPSSGLTPQRILLLAVGSILRRRRYDPRALATAIRQLREPDPEWWTTLASITAPTLVISGGPRSHIAADTLENVCREIPHAQMTTIPVGHRIHSLATDQFTMLVTTFLAP